MAEKLHLRLGEVQGGENVNSLSEITTTQALRSLLTDASGHPLISRDNFDDVIESSIKKTTVSGKDYIILLDSSGRAIGRFPERFDLAKSLADIYKELFQAEKDVSLEFEKMKDTVAATAATSQNLDKLAGSLSLESLSLDALIAQYLIYSKKDVWTLSDQAKKLSEQLQNEISLRLLKSPAETLAKLQKEGFLPVDIRRKFFLHYFVTRNDFFNNFQAAYAHNKEKAPKKSPLTEGYDKKQKEQEQSGFAFTVAVAKNYKVGGSPITESQLSDLLQKLFPGSGAKAMLELGKELEETAIVDLNRNITNLKDSATDFDPLAEVGSKGLVATITQLGDHTNMPNGVKKQLKAVANLAAIVGTVAALWKAASKLGWLGSIATVLGGYFGSYAATGESPFKLWSRLVFGTEGGVSGNPMLKELFGDSALGSKVSKVDGSSRDIVSSMTSIFLLTPNPKTAKFGDFKKFLSVKDGHVRFDVQKYADSLPDGRTKDMLRSMINSTGLKKTEEFFSAGFAQLGVTEEVLKDSSHEDKKITELINRGVAAASKQAPVPASAPVPQGSQTLPQEGAASKFTVGASGDQISRGGIPAESLPTGSPFLGDVPVSVTAAVFHPLGDSAQLPFPEIKIKYNSTLDRLDLSNLDFSGITGLVQDYVVDDAGNIFLIGADGKRTLLSEQDQNKREAYIRTMEALKRFSETEQLIKMLSLGMGKYWDDYANNMIGGRYFRSESYEAYKKKSKDISEKSTELFSRNPIDKDRLKEFVALAFDDTKVVTAVGDNGEATETTPLRDIAFGILTSDKSYLEKKLELAKLMRDNYNGMSESVSGSVSSAIEEDIMADQRFAKVKTLFSSEDFLAKIAGTIKSSDVNEIHSALKPYLESIGLKDNEIPSGQGWLQNMPITGDQVKYYGQKALVQGMIEKIAEVRRDIDSFTKSQEEAILKVMKTQSDSAGKTDLQMIEDFKNIQFRIALAPALRPLVLESYVQTNPQLREGGVSGKLVGLYSDINGFGSSISDRNANLALQTSFELALTLLTTFPAYGLANLAIRAVRLGLTARMGATAMVIGDIAVGGATFYEASTLTTNLLRNRDWNDGLTDMKEMSKTVAMFGVLRAVNSMYGALATRFVPNQILRESGRILTTASAVTGTSLAIDNVVFHEDREWSWSEFAQALAMVGAMRASGAISNGASVMVSGVRNIRVLNRGANQPPAAPAGGANQPPAAPAGGANQPPAAPAGGANQPPAAPAGGANQLPPVPAGGANQPPAAPAGAPNAAAAGPSFSDRIRSAAGNKWILDQDAAKLFTKNYWSQPGAVKDFITTLLTGNASPMPKNGFLWTASAAKRVMTGSLMISAAFNAGRDISEGEFAQAGLDLAEIPLYIFGGKLLSALYLFDKTLDFAAETQPGGKFHEFTVELGDKIGQENLERFLEIAKDFPIYSEDMRSLINNWLLDKEATVSFN